MEETESEVDPMDSHPTVAGARGTVDFDIVEGEMFEFFDCPRRKHYPCDDGINEQEESVCDTSCNTVAAFATSATDHGAGRGAAAAANTGQELKERGYC